MRIMTQCSLAVPPPSSRSYGNLPELFKIILTIWHYVGSQGLTFYLEEIKHQALGVGCDEPIGGP